MKANHTYTRIQEEFNKYLKLKAYKTGNGRMYSVAVREFCIFLEQRGNSFFDVSTEDMTDYYTYLTTRPKYQGGAGTLSQSTINHHLFGLRIFFDWVMISNIKEAMPVLPKFLRSKQVPLPILTVDEIKEMYTACSSRLETALLSVAYGCGLRRNEIEHLNFTDINLINFILIVRQGKGNKRREVPLSKKVVIDLKEYLYHERKMKSDLKIHSLFLTSRGNAFKGVYMNNMIIEIKNRVPALVEKKVTLHTLRRSIATHLVENGADIYFIKNFLGHSVIDTTQIYTIHRKRKIKIA